MKCAVKNCKNNNNNKSKSISFFNFPTDANLLQQWNNFCCHSNNKINVKVSRICMQHFKPEDFENNLHFEMGFTTRRLLKRDAVPTIRKVSSADENRAKRIERRENKKIVEMLIEEHDRASVSHNASPNPPSVKLTITEVRSESKIPSEHLNCSQDNYEKNKIDSFKTEIQRLQIENYSLKETSNRQKTDFEALKEKIEKESNMYISNINGLITQIKRVNCDLKNLEEKLLCVFTKGQLKKLKAGVKRTVWSNEDIMQANTLYSASPKLYEKMYRKHFPLPSIRSLQRWRQKFKYSKSIESK